MCESVCESHLHRAARLLLEFFALSELADLMTRLSVSTGAAHAAVNEPPAGGADAAALALAFGRSATVAAAAAATAVCVSIKSGG